MDFWEKWDLKLVLVTLVFGKGNRACRAWGLWGNRGVTASRCNWSSTPRCRLVLANSYASTNNWIGRRWAPPVVNKICRRVASYVAKARGGVRVI